MWADGLPTRATSCERRARTVPCTGSGIQQRRGGCGLKKSLGSPAEPFADGLGDRFPSRLE
jgi:hypothetical protein